MLPRSFLVVLVLAGIATAVLYFALRGDADPAAIPVEPSRVAVTPSARPPATIDLSDAASATGERARIEPPAVPAPAREVAPTSADLVVRGRFVDSDRAGVAGVACLIASVTTTTPWAEGDPIHDESNPLARAQSDADGAFSFDLSAPNGRITWLTFVCRSPGHVAIAVSLSVPEELRVFELGELALVPGARLAGTVRDDEGHVIDDAFVIVETPNSAGAWSTEGHRATATRAGSFVIEGAPTGPIRLSANTSDGRSSKQLPLEISTGEVRDGIELVLPMYTDRVAVSGIVYDVDGTPLGGARIQWSAEITGSGGGGSGMTDDRGHFRLHAERATSYTLTASHPRGAATSVSRTVPPGTHGLEIRLEPVVRIALHVRTPDGSPVAEFSHRLNTRTDRFTQQGEWVAWTRASTGTPSILLPANAFVVDVVAAGYTSVSTPEYAPDAPPAVIELVVRPVPPLHGHVRNGKRPIAGARVRAHAALAPGVTMSADGYDLVVAPWDRGLEAITSADGSFELVVPSEGLWHVRAVADGHPSVISGAVDVVSGHETKAIAVDVGPRGVLAGRVRDANGAPLARRTVAASCGDGSPLTTVTDAQGEYRFEHVAPVGWHVRVLASGLGTRQTNVMRGESLDGITPPIAWDCRVVDGTVTRHDLVVSQP